jgi:hypothetical protein
MGEDAARERAERRNERENERVESPLGSLTKEGFAAGAQRLEPGEPTEQEALAEFESRKECSADETRGDPYCSGVKQHPAEEAQLEGRVLREQRDGAQRIAATARHEAAAVTSSLVFVRLIRHAVPCAVWESTRIKADAHETEP